jgi:hypothetical protein
MKILHCFQVVAGISERNTDMCTSHSSHYTPELTLHISTPAPEHSFVYFAARSGETTEGCPPPERSYQPPTAHNDVVMKEETQLLASRSQSSTLTICTCPPNSSNSLQIKHLLANDAVKTLLPSYACPDEFDEPRLCDVTKWNCLTDTYSPSTPRQICTFRQK